MKKIKQYIAVVIPCLIVMLLCPMMVKQYQHRQAYLGSPARSTEAMCFISSLPSVPKPKEKVLNKKIYVKSIPLKQVAFETLPGWQEADVKKSLLAFQASCKTFMSQNAKEKVGSRFINMRAEDWQPACEASFDVDARDEEQAKTFFETWFKAVELGRKKPMKGVFTGYYMPEIKGSLQKTADFKTPIYGLPYKHSLAKSFSRAEIDNGALNGKAPVLAWIKSPVDRAFLEIEGAGVIKLSNGKRVYLTYAGENGAHYASVATVLIQKGLISRHQASKTMVKQYLDQHPRIVNEVLHQNRSFVFFEALAEPAALGARNTPLTPGYSLAVDKRWIPLGTPLWLATKHPLKTSDEDKQFKRLMIAQDTGGSIKGIIRGDVYWGAGKRATFLGEHMKNTGRYWLLLPTRVFNRLFS